MPCINQTVRARNQYQQKIFGPFLFYFRKLTKQEKYLLPVTHHAAHALSCVIFAASDQNWSVRLMTFDEIKEKLRDKTVGIAGAGGLGSNCAVALARVGMGNLIIADFDMVSPSNLNRQYYFHQHLGIKKVLALKGILEEVNPEIKVEIHDIKLDHVSVVRIFRDCDVIVEAFDHAPMKKMIIETVLSTLPGIPVVAGLGMAGYGNSNSLKVRRINQLYICGDEHSEIADENPPIAPRVGIVANMQANTVLEILLDK